MRVLVTGGAGLIGSHLVDELLSAGYEVNVLDNLEPEVHPNGRPDWIPDSVRFLHGDVRDTQALNEALDGCGGVFHLAAYGGFSPEFSRITDVNCTGTSRLFEVIRKHPTVRKIVTASSMAIYGEGWYRCAEHGPFHGTPRAAERLERSEWELPCPECGASTVAHPIEEGSPVSPASVYAASKFFQERLTLTEGKAIGIGAVALRYFLTYGPRQSVDNPYCGICSIFSTRVAHDLPPVIYEDGLQSRDMVFVSDVARANRLVFERPEADDRVFNVCSGKSVGIGDFARAVAAAHGSSIEPETGLRFRPQDNRHNLGDPTALQALGWEPQVALDEGLRRYVDWFKTRSAVSESFGAAELKLQEVGVVRSVQQRR